MTDLPISVLIVEDEEASADLVGLWLAASSLKFETLYASSLTRALAVLADRQPDLIICDLKIPNGHLTAMEILSAVRTAAPDAGIITHTARTETPELTHQLLTLANYCLWKPLEAKFAGAICELVWLRSRIRVLEGRVAELETAIARHKSHLIKRIARPVGEFIGGLYQGIMRK